MGYLRMVFDTYYESDNEKQKQALRKGFSQRLWDSLPYKKLNRTFKYDVVDDKIEDKEIEDLFKQYQKIPYKILKSRYNINNLQKEDLVRARVNSNYGKYFDKEVYLGKEYYKHLAHIRNLYFNYIMGNCDDNVDIKQEVINTYNKAMEFKEDALSRKMELSWEEYQVFIEKCLDRIFENYIPVDENPNIDWEDNMIWDWDEDNVVLCYINKNLNGYLKNHIRDMKKPKEKFCQECGCNINPKSNAKYCKECSLIIRKEKHAMHQKEYIKRKQQVNNEHIKICKDCLQELINPKPRQRYCLICKSKRDKARHKKYNNKRRVTKDVSNISN